MKSIFKSHLNGGANLLKNKKLLFAAVLSSVAINCDATLQRIDNAPKKEDTRVLYQIQKEVAGEEYVEARCDLENFEALIDTTQQAWDNREQKDFFKLIDYDLLRKQGIEDDVGLQTSLVFAYSAWRSFQTQLPIGVADIECAVKMFCDMYRWHERNELLTNLTFYLFDKPWRGAFWIDAINQLEKAEGREVVTKRLQEEITTKISAFCLQIVSTYIRTPEDFKRFKMINKMCARVVNELHFNPIPITNSMSDELVHNLLPKLKTQILYSANDRKIKIGNGRGVEIGRYEVEHIFHIESRYFDKLPDKNVEFPRGIMCPYEKYISKKQRIAELKTLRKSLLEQIYEKEMSIYGKEISMEKHKVEEEISLLEKSRTDYFDEKNDLTNFMKQFIVNINWNEWNALNEEKRKELDKQKESGKIKGIEKHFCPLYRQDFEHYIVDTTFAVPLGVDYIELQNVHYLVRCKIKRIEVPKSVKIIAPFGLSYYENVSEIIFGSAGIEFKGDGCTFFGCKSLRRIYVLDAGERGIEYFKRKLIRAGLDENVDVIHGYNM